MPLDVSIEQIYTGHADAIYSLLPGRQPHQLYSGSGDQFVGSWDMLTGVFEHPLAKMPATVYALAKHPELPLLAIGLQNGYFFVIDLDSRKILRNYSLGKQGLYDVAYLPEVDAFAVAGGDGVLTLVDCKTLEVNFSKVLSSSSLRKFSISPCGRFMMVGASDNKAYFIAVIDGQPVLKQVLSAHDSSVFSVLYLSGYRLATGGRDALLKTWNWDADAGQWILDQVLPAHNFTVNNMALNPSGTLLATASRDKTVKLWNPEDMTLLKVLDLPKYPQAHTHSVNTVLWASSDRLLTAGDDKRIIGWKIS